MSREPSVYAYATMAAAYLWSAYEAWVETAWEYHGPDIGQYDFDRIVDLMGKMLPTDPKRDSFEKAYELFAARAKEDDDER